MAASKYTVPASLKVAAFSLDAVWYLTWVMTAASTLFAIVLLILPAQREALVRRGVLHAGATFSMPLEVRYTSVDLGRTGTARGPRPAEGGSHAGLASNGVRVLGFNDVMMEAPIEAGDIVVGIVGRLIAAAIFLWVVAQLRALAHSVKRGRAFDPLNPKRIRVVGWLVVASGPLRDVGSFYWVVESFRSVKPAVLQAVPNATVTPHGLAFSWEPIVAGFIILVIAHAFEAGVRLQDDHDLTV